MKSALNLIYARENRLNPICEYIRQNINEYRTLNINNIAITIKKSKATIVRFFKKNEFTGFTDFKQILIFEIMQNENKKIVDLTIDQVVRNYNNLKQLNQETQIIDLILKIKTIGVIYFLAFDEETYLVSQLIAKQFKHFKIKVFVFFFETSEDCFSFFKKNCSREIIIFAFLLNFNWLKLNSFLDFFLIKNYI